MGRKSGISLDHYRLIACHIGLPYSIIQIVEKLAEKETKKDQSKLLRKLIFEALRNRGLIK